MVPSRISLMLSLPLCVAMASCAGSQGVSARKPSLGDDATAKIGSKKDENLSQILSRVAARAAKAGNHSTAALFYGRVLQLQPENRAALVGLADAYSGTGRASAAADIYRRAISANPTDSVTRAKLGRTLLTLNQPREAIRHLKTAYARLPSVEVLNDIGVAHQLVGQTKAAQRSFRNGLESNPASPVVRNNLAVSLALAGESGEAIRLMRPLLYGKKSFPVHRTNLAHFHAMTRPGNLRDRQLALLSYNAGTRPTVIATLDGLGRYRMAGAGRGTGKTAQAATKTPKRAAEASIPARKKSRAIEWTAATAKPKPKAEAAKSAKAAPVKRRFTNTTPTMFEFDKERLGEAEKRPDSTAGFGQDGGYRKLLLDGIATTVRPRQRAHKAKPVKAPYARDTIKPTPLPAPSLHQAAPAANPAGVSASEPGPTPAPPRLRIAPRATRNAIPPSPPRSLPLQQASTLFKIQLGAYFESKNAHAARVRALRAATDLFGGVELIVDSVDVVGKGRMYRLRTSKATGRPEAEALCAKLKSRSIGCFLSASQGG